MSTGAGLLGYNMYAYCVNNPIMGCDPLGAWTISIGAEVSAFMIAGISYSINIVIDGYGNIGLQTSKADLSGGNGVILGLAGIGSNSTAAFTKAKTINDLEDMGASYGSVSIGTYSADIMASIDRRGDQEIIGFSISKGASVNIGPHINLTRTETKKQFNIGEELTKLWQKIRNWF